MASISLPKEQLLAPLIMVTGIVEKRHTMPILSNVLIEHQQGSLRILGSDLEIQVDTSCLLDGAGDDCRFTTSAKKLTDILRALPDGATIKLDFDEDKLLLRSGKSRFQLHTLPADDLPQVRIDASPLCVFSLSQERFKYLLSKVQYAMANQDIRYYLNGLLISCNASTLRFIATDGHRLAYIEETMPASLTACEAIIPRKTIIELSKLLQNSSATVVVEMFPNQIQFKFDSTTLISKVIEGKFPDYNRVIPSENDRFLECGRDALIQALQRAAILSNEKFRGVRLFLENNSLRILSANTEQEEAQEELDVRYVAPALDIGFNFIYLLDVLLHAEHEEIRISFTDTNGSALVTEPEMDNFKYVVMPMRI